MKSRPIIFEGRMIRSLLAGKKRMTRRSGIPNDADYVEHYHGQTWDLKRQDGLRLGSLKCPFGEVGDQLWVRETFTICDLSWPHVHFRADGESQNPNFKWKPSIHMPRRISRITLTIADIRVERLQDITEEDAKAEGVDMDNEPCDHARRTCSEIGCLGPTYKCAFAQLWNTIYGNWDKNPLVWVIEFEVTLKESE